MNSLCNIKSILLPLYEVASINDKNELIVWSSATYKINTTNTIHEKTIALELIFLFYLRKSRQLLISLFGNLSFLKYDSLNSKSDFVKFDYYIVYDD